MPIQVEAVHISLFLLDRDYVVRNHLYRSYKQVLQLLFFYFQYYRHYDKNGLL